MQLKKWVYEKNNTGEEPISCIKSREFFISGALMSTPACICFIDMVIVELKQQQKQTKHHQWVILLQIYY